MKILLSFVGEQDPISENTNEEGSIITLCRQLQPDAVYLYPTAFGETVLSETQTHADETRHWIATEISPSIQVFIEPLMLPDPTDFAAILPKIHQVLKERPELKADDCEVHLNCSSGTPQMKSIWLVIANSGLLPGCRLWQVMNPRFAAKRVKELQIEFLEEENILNRLTVFAGQFLFSQMAEEMGRLRNISLFAARREKARFLQKIFWVYQDWDMIKYKKAYAGDGLRPGLKDLVVGFKQVPADHDDRNLKKVLLKQVSVLEKLNLTNQKETTINLSDLYYNAHRCFVRGNYTDTLARFWRVYEGILYYRLRNTYGIEPTRPGISRNQDNLKRIYSAVPDVMSHVALGVRRSELVLSEAFHDTTFQELSDRPIQKDKGVSTKVGSLLRELREARNDSIAAHGMKPVDNIAASNALKVLQELFAGFFPEYNLAQYPFQYNHLKVIVEYLTKNFSA